MSGKKSAKPIPQDVRKLIDQALPRICARAIELIDNSDVAPSAQAQIISTLFRAAGLFNQDGSKRDKEPHEMTPEELADALQEARGRAFALTEGGEHSTDADGGEMADILS